MICPWCGKEMLHGNITGSKVLRLAPDPESPKQVHRIFQDVPDRQFDNGLEGHLLDVTYAGLAPWIPADYCMDCRRVVFEANILGPRKGGGTL